MIVLVGGEKGGTGKTTLATNLAAMRAALGRDVLLIDTDTQGSASSWSEIRAEEKISPAIACVAKFGQGVREAIRSLATRYDDLVIDAGGRDSVELRQAMLCADVMVIPARPSQFDLHAMAAIDRVVGDVRGFNTALHALVVINAAPTHPNMADVADMRSIVGDMRHVALTDVVLHDRIAFRRAARDGLAVTEQTPNDTKATAEMLLLYAEVFGS